MDDKVQWLEDFDNGLNRARQVQSSPAHLAYVMEESGNERLAAKLGILVNDLTTAIADSNEAISRMVSEQVSRSFRCTEETLKALLEATTRR